MATQSYAPTQDNNSPGYFRFVGAPTIWQCLDQSTASYVESYADTNVYGQFAGPIVGWAASLAGAVPVGKVAWATFMVQHQRGPDAPGGGRGYCALGGANGWTPGQSVYDDCALNSWQWLTLPPMFITTQGDVPGAFPVSYPYLWCATYGEGGITGGTYWRFNGAQLSVYYVYDPPTATVTGPAGSFTTNRITVTWTFTPATLTGGGGSPFIEDYFQVRLYPPNVANAPGFDPNVTTPYYDSGQRPTYNGASFDVPVQLDTGSYVAFVRVASIMNYGSSYYQRITFWSAWARGGTFYITSAPPPIAPPTIPTNMVNTLSTRNRNALAEPHVPTFQAVLYWWDGSAHWPLELIDGSVTTDLRSLIRRKCTLSVADTDLVPPSASPISFAYPLHPFGSYISLARGVGDQLVNLGTFRIESVAWQRSGKGASTVKVEGSDWAAYVGDARFTIPQTRQSWNGSTLTPQLVSEVFAAICTEARVSVNAAATTDRVAANYLNDRTMNRLDALKGLADAEGFRMFASVTGQMQFGKIRDFATAPISAVFVEGANATIVSQSSTLSRDQVFDVVIAANDEVSIVGSAYDGNPTSPIARSGSASVTPWQGAGPFVPAIKPYFFASPIIVDQSGAQAAAMTILQRVAVPSDRITIATVPMPDLHVDDVATLQRFNTAEAGRFYVETITCPLDVTSEMTVVLAAPPTYINAQAGT